MALAQQGKPVEERLLQQYEGREYPVPTVATAGIIKTRLKEKETPDKGPAIFHYTYKELQDLDSVTLTPLSLKKGMVLKHTEYELESYSTRVRVLRRYRDFDALNDLLLSRYPYRLVPRLPPKKLNPDETFLVERKQALVRYINLVCRHPELRNDEAVKFFLTFNGKDISGPLKDRYRSRPDEFETHEHGKTAREYLDSDIHTRADSMKREIVILEKAFKSVLVVTKNIASRNKALAQDMTHMYKAFEDVSRESGGSSTWAPNSLHEVWGKMKNQLSQISQKMSVIPDISKSQAQKASDGYVNDAAYFYELILAFSDLFERRDKLIVQKMQRLQSKQSSGEDLVLIGNRNNFSLFVLNLEGQLFHANFEHLTRVMMEFTEGQLFGYKELVTAWEGVLPQVEKLQGSEAFAGSPGLSVSGGGYKGFK